MDRELSVKQQRLVNEYLANGGNGVKAAQAAGYAGSYDTLRSVASETLAKPNVRMHLRARLEAEAVTPDRIIAEMAKIAFMDDERCKVIEYDRTGAVKCERFVYTDKNVALANLARIRGMLRETAPGRDDAPIRQLMYLPPTHPLRARVVSGERDADVETEPEIQADRNE